MRPWRRARRTEAVEPRPLRPPGHPERDRVCEERISDLEGELACCEPDDLGRVDRIERAMERARGGLDGLGR